MHRMGKSCQDKTKCFMKRRDDSDIYLLLPEAHVVNKRAGGAGPTLSMESGTWEEAESVPEKELRKRIGGSR